MQIFLGRLTTASRLDVGQEIIMNKFFSRIISSQVFPYTACFCAALILAGFTVSNVWQQHQLKMIAERGPVVPHITTSTVLSGRSEFLGSPLAPYTLVEFGDYECPPCRHNQPLIASLLSRYDGRIKLDFRQFPLQQLHPHAEEAAVSAESVRPLGKFWPVHKRLFEIDLSKKRELTDLLKGYNLTSSHQAANKQIYQDRALAEKLEVTGTPTFFLCCPDGSVRRLPNAKAVELNIL